MRFGRRSGAKAPRRGENRPEPIRVNSTSRVSRVYDDYENYDEDDGYEDYDDYNDDEFDAYSGINAD